MPYRRELSNMKVYLTILLAARMPHSGFEVACRHFTVSVPALMRQYLRLWLHYMSSINEDYFSQPSCEINVSAFGNCHAGLLTLNIISPLYRRY